jgi:acetolactate synthase-1/2/3 large subunit
LNGKRKNVNVSDFIIEFFEGKGVEHIFTVSGGGSIFLCDALARAKRMKYVCTHHEQGAGYATEAYARLRGLGVCLVTSGPGGTNAVSPCAAAWLDSVPVIFLSGQAFLKQTIGMHPGLRQLGVQEINILDIVKPITKYAVMVNAEHVKYQLETAVRLATTGRPGPVWLDVPGDVQNARF